MNDRFKFRVWSDKQKKMYYWSDIIKMTNSCYALFVDNRALGEGLWFVQQSTGLKDKNGKLIYEGDIIKENWHIYKLEWGNGAYTIKDIKRGTSYMFTSGLCIEKSEVIGNIYKNKELLEECE